MDSTNDINSEIWGCWSSTLLISLAILFGSMAKGTAGPESDLDLAIHADRPLTTEDTMHIIEDLALLTGRPIDLVDMRTAGLPILKQIFAKGRRILGPRSLYATLLTRFQMDYADFMPIHERVLKERRMRWLKK